jgi:hypothetical protein
MHVVSIGSSPNTYMTRAEIAEREAQTLRKRQILIVTLIIFFFATIIAAFANAVPFKSLLLPLSLLVIFVVHVRRQKVQEDVRRRRRAATMRSKGSSFNFSEITYRTPERQTSQWIPINHSRTVTVIPNDTWQPSDMPLPTYVNAPKAPARPVVGRNNTEQTNTHYETEIEQTETSFEKVFDQEEDRKASNG